MELASQKVWYLILLFRRESPDGMHVVVAKVDANYTGTNGCRSRDEGAGEERTCDNKLRRWTRLATPPLPSPGTDVTSDGQFIPGLLSSDAGEDC